MKKQRRYDLDWLRVLSMLTIFLFHCARLFNYEDWHVKNNHLSQGMSDFIDILALWIMPLFFLISAASSNYSLDKRGGGEYLKERFKRLFIPLVFGAFVVIAPVQVWIERATHEPYYTGSFMNFYIHSGNNFRNTETYPLLPQQNAFAMLTFLKAEWTCNKQNAQAVLTNLLN